MYVSITLCIALLKGSEHHCGLVGSGGVIEVNEWLALVYLLGEGGEIGLLYCTRSNILMVFVKDMVKKACVEEAVSVRVIALCRAKHLKALFCG